MSDADLLFHLICGACVVLGLVVLVMWRLTRRLERRVSSLRTPRSGEALLRRRR